MKTAIDTQIGGQHYKCLKMQPIELIVKANLNFIQGNIIKYISRYEHKNGLQDIKKCIHYAQLAIELNSIDSNMHSIGLGYSFCKANEFNAAKTNVIISAMQNDYYNVIRYCNQIIKQQYS